MHGFGKVLGGVMVAGAAALLSGTQAGPAIAGPVEDCAALHETYGDFRTCLGGGSGQSSQRSQADQGGSNQAGQADNQAGQAGNQAGQAGNQTDNQSGRTGNQGSQETNQTGDNAGNQHGAAR